MQKPFKSALEHLDSILNFAWTLSKNSSQNANIRDITQYGAGPISVKTIEFAVINQGWWITHTFKIRFAVNEKWAWKSKIWIKWQQWHYIEFTRQNLEIQWWR